MGVSYNGHQKPFIPRAIRPISWDNRSNKNMFFAIQHKSKSQNQQRFFLKYVVEVRDKQWRISNNELTELKKRNNEEQYDDNNNYGGGSKRDRRQYKRQYRDRHNYRDRDRDREQHTQDNNQ